MAHRSFFKEPRGTYVLEREQRRAALEQRERDIIAEAKRRDGYRCRWPEVHKCRGGLEGAHIRAKGMGGDHGTRTETGTIVTLCAWIHRRGPATVEHHQLRIDAETKAGADGPLSFWKQDERGAFYCIARERGVGILDRD